MIASCTCPADTGLQLVRLQPNVDLWHVQMWTPQGPALLWRGYREPAAWIALVWSALGPGALAAYLQTQVFPVCLMSRSCLSGLKPESGMQEL